MIVAFDPNSSPIGDVHIMCVLPQDYFTSKLSRDGFEPYRIHCRAAQNNIVWMHWKDLSFKSIVESIAFEVLYIYFTVSFLLDLSLHFIIINEIWMIIDPSWRACMSGPEVMSVMILMLMMIDVMSDINFFI
jgi:hypothetical protein